MTPAVQRGVWEQAIAAVENDGERLIRTYIDTGFARADDPPPADVTVAWARHIFTPIHAPQPFTFTPEWAADLLGQMADMDKEMMRRVTVPKDFVFTNRISAGLYSVLGELRATADWRAIFDEDVTGRATTELGRLEADYFTAKNDA